jgi:hypothetical protein
MPYREAPALTCPEAMRRSFPSISPSTSCSQYYTAEMSMFDAKFRQFVTLVTSSKSVT